jgi:hypothetical protein
MFGISRIEIRNRIGLGHLMHLCSKLYGVITVNQDGKDIMGWISPWEKISNSIEWFSFHWILYSMKLIKYNSWSGINRNSMIESCVLFIEYYIQWEINRISIIELSTNCYVSIPKLLDAINNSMNLIEYNWL